MRCFCWEQLCAQRKCQKQTKEQGKQFFFPINFCVDKKRILFFVSFNPPRVDWREQFHRSHCQECQESNSRHTVSGEGDEKDCPWIVHVISTFTNCFFCGLLELKQCFSQRESYKIFSAKRKMDIFTSSWWKKESLFIYVNNDPCMISSRIQKCWLCEASVLLTVSNYLQKWLPNGLFDPCQ